MSSRTKYIAPRRVQEAFGPLAAERYLAVVASIAGARLQIHSLGGEEQEVILRDAAAVAGALEQHDLTLVDDRPLLLVNESLGLLAIARGPVEPPARLEALSGVVRLSDLGAAEMFGTDDAQPSWLLFEIETVHDEMRANAGKV